MLRNALFPPCRRRRAALAVGLTLAVGLLFAGCDEKEKTTPCPSSGIQLEMIYATADSVAIGATVQFYALPQLSDLKYAWTASAGRFLTLDGSFAEWKAPDTPVIARISVVAFNEQDRSEALSVPVAVDKYLPRHTPTYTGASYCGLECHAVAGHGSHYDTWIKGKHAAAFPILGPDPLQLLPLHVNLTNAVTPPCALCHTVGFNDRDALDRPRYNAGYDEVPVARLQGVQCESCHGPLSDRYGEILPDHAARAFGDSLFVLGTPARPVGCATCHENTPIAKCSSAQCHAGAPPTKPYGKSYLTELTRGTHAALTDGANPANPQCAQCHTAQGFVARLETGAPPLSATRDPQPITCPACHDPHGTPFVADLRVSPDRDVCSRCHTDAGAGYPATPHTPQEQALAGEGGYEYAGVAYPSSPHGPLVLQGDVAHRGCVHCHYDETFRAISHSFAPDPSSCVRCHPEANGTNFAWNPRRSEIFNLLGALRAELASAAPADTLTEAFRRARFNYRFVDRDGSLGAHNYLYARALLQSSLDDFTPTPGR
jgi:predicted CXXCH cytochrome family protein